jgi:hypothetical protein
MERIPILRMGKYLLVTMALLTASIVDEFHIESGPGSGTRVTLARWK